MISEPAQHHVTEEGEVTKRIIDVKEIRVYMNLMKVRLLTDYGTAR